MTRHTACNAAAISSHLHAVKMRLSCLLAPLQVQPAKRRRKGSALEAPAKQPQASHVAASSNAKTAEDAEHSSSSMVAGKGSEAECCSMAAEDVGEAGDGRMAAEIAAPAGDGVSEAGPSGRGAQPDPALPDLEDGQEVHPLSLEWLRALPEAAARQYLMGVAGAPLPQCSLRAMLMP